MTRARSSPVSRSMESSPTCGVYRLIQISRVCGFCLPVIEELLYISVAADLLPGDGAVHRDLVSDDVLEDAVVGGGRSPHVVLGLEAVDRDDDLEPPESGPFAGDRPHRTGDQLRVDAAFGELGQDLPSSR